MGVRRAVELAEKALADSPASAGEFAMADSFASAEASASAAGSKKVFSLGPLIHNKTALADLASRGLFVLNENQLGGESGSASKNSSASSECNLQECGASAVGKSLASGGRSLNASVVIIRAHGVPPETQNRLEQNGFEIVDATCPLVKRSQKIAAEYSEKGNAVILAGDKNHGEVIGIAGYAGENFVLVQNEAEAKCFDALTSEVYVQEAGRGGCDRNAVSSETISASGNTDCNNGTHSVSSKINYENAVLLAQTTFSESEFCKIENALSSKFKNLKVINTICPATQERQNALLELAPKVDGILVIGGKNSANTSRLLASAKNICKHAALIETADEIPEEFFSLEKVGLTAGASTPDSVIDAVEQKLTS